MNDASSGMRRELRCVPQPVAARVEIQREPFVAEMCRIPSSATPPHDFSSNAF